MTSEDSIQRPAFDDLDDSEIYDYDKSDMVDVIRKYRRLIESGEYLSKKELVEKIEKLDRFEDFFGVIRFVDIYDLKEIVGLSQISQTKSQGGVKA